MKDHAMDNLRSRMRVKVKATGQTGVIYGPVSRSGTTFRVLEVSGAVTQPIPTEWAEWHVSLDAGGMATFTSHELEEIEDDEESARVRHERAEAEWQEFLRRTYA